VLPSEAIHFLVEKINGRATVEGRALSAGERRLLAQPDAEAEESDEGACGRLAGLLRRSYVSASRELRRQFREACEALTNDGSILAEVVQLSGLASPVRARLLPYRGVGLFLVLAVPGVAALLAAAVLLWVAATGGRVSPDMRATVGVFGIAFVGFGAHLLNVWRTDRRG
jgi:hypothetical protein